MIKTIWEEKIRGDKNHTLGFLYSGRINSGDVILEITASNLYRLFINGKLSGYGPARSAHGYVRIDKYDLSSFLDKAQDNSSEKNSYSDELINKDSDSDELINIVVEVFAANVNSYYLVDEQPFFGASISSNGKEIHDSKDFRSFLLNDRVSKIQRYSFQRPFAESYIMQKCRSNFYNGDTSMFEEVNTTLVPGDIIIERNIDYPKFESIDYLSEIETGSVEINKNNWKWDDRCIKAIDEKFKGYKYEDLDECISDEVCKFDYEFTGEKSSDSLIRRNSYKLFDFGRTITGFFDLKVNAIIKSTLYIVFDEIIWSEDKPSQKEKNICFYRNTCCNILKFTLDAGVYNLVGFEPSTARFAKIIVLDGEINLEKLAMIPYENKNAYNLKVDFGDKKLQAIVQSAANTFSQNAVDILTDCPSRERAGWLCDAYFSGRAEKLFTGKNEIERNFLEGFVLAPQLKELPLGMLPMCYPADHLDGVYIPNWSMWFVLELFDYSKRTGDYDLLQRSKVKLYNLVDFFKKYINEDGLLENLESWVFIEWSKCNDAEFIKGVNYPSNMIYSAMLLAIGQMYDDASLLDQSNKINETIKKQSFNGEFFEDNKIRENGNLVSKKHETETCQYYAIYFGVASKEEFPGLFETMITKFGPKRDVENIYPNVHKSNAIVGNYLRLEILLQNNLWEYVLEECKDFFYFMALRTGTLWEHSYAYGSLNHGFASVAANYIVESVTGFVKADLVDKKIYFKNTDYYCDASVSIPMADEKLKISITEKGRTVAAPAGYEVIELG